MMLENKINMGKYRSLDEEFKAIGSIEKKIYERFNHIQHQEKDAINKQMQQIEMERERKAKMHDKSGKQIVKHPANQQIWKQLANVISQRDFIQLDEIELRRQERERIREEMAEKHHVLSEKNKCGQKNQWGYEQFQVSEVNDMKRQRKGQKIAWKLTRELRRKQVQENKRRLQKIHDNQRQKMSKYHQY